MNEFLPFHHVLNVRTLPRKGRSERHVPKGEVLTAMAKHLDVEAVEAVTFTAEVTPWKRDGIRVEGTMTARVHQLCVVSLDPVVSNLDETFETILVPEGSKLAAPRADPGMDPSGELLLDAESEDPPETFEGDTIDLAAIWLEFLSLAIDPFPRAPEAELPEAAKSEKPSAFAALAALKPANDE